MSKDPLQSMFSEAEYLEIKHNAAMHALRIKNKYIKNLERELQLQEILNDYLEELAYCTELNFEERERVRMCSVDADRALQEHRRTTRRARLEDREEG